MRLGLKEGSGDIAAIVATEEELEQLSTVASVTASTGMVVMSLLTPDGVSELLVCTPEKFDQLAAGELTEGEALRLDVEAESLREKLWRAFLAGFNASGEGFNGEWSTTPDADLLATLRETFNEYVNP